jgi:hypothetical protein
MITLSGVAVNKPALQDERSTGSPARLAGAYTMVT